MSRNWLRRRASPGTQGVRSARLFEAAESFGVDTYVYIHIHVYIYIYTQYLCMYIYMYIYLYIYIRMYIYVCVWKFPKMEDIPNHPNDVDHFGVETNGFGCPPFQETTI